MIRANFLSRCHKSWQLREARGHLPPVVSVHWFKKLCFRSYLRTEVGLVKKSSAMSRKNPKDLTQKASHSSRISNNPKICPQKVKLQPKTFKTHLSKRVGKQIATSTKPMLIFVVTGQGSTRTFSNSRRMKWQDVLLWTSNWQYDRF